MNLPSLLGDVSIQRFVADYYQPVAGAVSASSEDELRQRYALFSQNLARELGKLVSDPRQAERFLARLRAEHHQTSR